MYRKSASRSVAFLRDIVVAQVRSIDRPTHRNLVQIQTAYWHDGRLSILYEPTLVSLDQLLTFRPAWDLDDTATVCREVVSGLTYIHQSLEIAHGSLTADQIRLSLDGSVKIGQSARQVV